MDFTKRKKNLSAFFIVLFLSILSSAHGLIQTVPGKPGQFKEYPDRYSGRGTGFSKGSFMDCQTFCSRHDGLCREYNRDREIREEKAKLKYPKKPGKMTLLQMAGGKPAVKVPAEDCDKHLRNCRVPCGKQP